MMVSLRTPKVFGVGFQKTGTSSLGQALTILGYRVAGPFGVTREDIGDVVVERALRIARRHDAVQDSPWPLLFRELDDAFPGSKFVLTHREPERWIASVVRHFGDRETPMREWIYGPGAGSPVGNEDLYVDRYLQHLTEVREHFRDRPEQLLEMSMADGDGWDELCGFLGAPVPVLLPFPRTNTAVQRESVTPGT